jgi:hypothetical protein
MPTFRHQLRLILPIALLLVVIGRAPAALAAPAQPSAASASGAQLLALVNAERANAGLGSLQWRDDVAAIAQDWTGQMAAAGALSHNDSYFSDATRRLIGSQARGENVAFSGSVEAAHWAFMNSPGHRANILNPAFTEVGIGAVRAADGTTWVTEDFLQSSGAAVAAPPAPQEPDPAPAPEAPSEPEPVITPTKAAAPATLPPTSLAPVTVQAPAVTAPPETVAPATAAPTTSPEVEAKASGHPASFNAPATASPLGLVAFVAAGLISLDLIGLQLLRRRRA